MLLRHQWYAQGVSATPLFITPSAMSGFMLKETIGLDVEYQHFLFRFADDWSDMLYDISDMKKVWNCLYKEICKNNLYIAEKKSQYDKAFDGALEFFEMIRNADLSILSDKEIIDMFQQVWDWQRKSVGIGHILESLSVIGSDMIQDKIANETNKFQNINELMAQLFDYDGKSFVSREEDDLLAIARESENKQKELLQKHLEAYYWIHNTYAVMNTASVETFKERMEKLLREKSSKRRKVVEKEKLMRDLGLSDETKQLVRIFNYCALWQDSRKENILKSLSAFDLIVNEIALRSGVKREILSYLGALEAKRLKSISDLKDFSDVLQKRRQGCYYYLTRDREFFVTGKEYQEGYDVQYKHWGDDKHEEIRGMTASMGKVTGKVKVCTTLELLKDFSEGEVLVAHMTRPEYTQAMKKAAAIITDEGGITCHAAIVSREMHKPCIIGTKIATKVLHDGDLVEVDADKGIVRILKKAK